MQVVTAFFDYAKSREIIPARQKAVDLSERNLRNAQVKNELGIRPRSDILRWEAQVATDKGNLIEAENSASIQKISLANLIGIDLSSPFEIVSVREKEVSELFVKYSALVTGNIEQPADRLYGDAIQYPLCY